MKTLLSFYLVSYNLTYLSSLEAVLVLFAFLKIEIISYSCFKSVVAVEGTTAEVIILIRCQAEFQL